MEGRQQQAIAQVQARQEPAADGRSTPAPGLLVVETDGVQVRSRDRARPFGGNPAARGTR